MVSEDFKREIKRLFEKGLEEALTTGSDASRWKFREKSGLGDIKENECFILTVSSQLFRVFVLLHFTKGPRTEALAAEALKVGANAIDSDKFYDYLGEVGNAFCGTIKRELTKTVPSLGMSTPNRLSRDCLKYFDALKIDYETHSVANYDDEPLFYASVYLSADDEINYTINHTSANEDEVDSGELEFF